MLCHSGPTLVTYARSLLAILHVLEFLTFKPRRVCCAALDREVRFQFFPQGFLGFSYPAVLLVRIVFFFLKKLTLGDF